MGEAIKFFYELTDGEYKALQDLGGTWGDDIASRHPQPEWCNYPGALDGLMGCWSLYYRMVKSEDYCRVVFVQIATARVHPLPRNDSRLTSVVKGVENDDD